MDTDTADAKQLVNVLMAHNADDDDNCAIENYWLLVGTFLVGYFCVLKKMSPICFARTHVSQEGPLADHVSIKHHNNLLHWDFRCLFGLEGSNGCSTAWHCDCHLVLLFLLFW